ncbi:S8/S53 family peptidase [Amycolatopsis solani]|uniref:S8/S53 family peptidase n=1 Tax=Amycolatopsis solani TaxID=3028615 RepID=UPI0025AEE791|nr:S8/S53 family peptidase [Amycolatopsis sp. MEP2-6]
MAQQDELIVDSNGFSQVKEKLSEWGLWGNGTTSAEEDERLRLTLIKDLTDLPAYAERAKYGYRNEIEMLEKRTDRLFGDIDVLLYDLRVRFAAEAGRIPVAGKNRDTFIGYPQHKGYADPIPLEEEPSFTPGVQTSDSIRVGVVDTPFFRLPQFTEEIVTAGEGPSPDANGHYDPLAGHSTFVVAKIHEEAPDAHIVVKAGLDTGTGRNSVWETARKIAEFADTPIDVLNLSFGTRTDDAQPPLALRRAIDKVRAAHPDVIVVAAAGNRGHLPSPPLAIWPAAMTDVEAVSTEASFAVVDRPWVEMIADGTDVDGFYLDGPVRLSRGITAFTGQATWSGTSFAAASVSGAVADQLRKYRKEPHKAVLAVLRGPIATAHRPT